MSVMRSKPMFNKDQIYTSSDAAKRFGTLRKKAKENPQYIMVNGTIATVVMDYQRYEEMYMRLQELEEQIIEKRMDDLERDSEMAVSWKQIRRQEE